MTSDIDMAYSFNDLFRKIESRMEVKIPKSK